MPAENSAIVDGNTAATDLPTADAADVGGAGPAREKTITLDVPLKRGAQEITTLVLRRPTTGALRGVSITSVLQMDTGAIMTVLPRISTPTLTKQDVEKMDVADLTECGITLAGFFLRKSERDSPTE